MYELTDRLVQEVEKGRLSRRDAVTRILAVAAATFAGSSMTEAASSSTFESRGLNHIALNVPDIPKARDFYQQHLGLGLLQQSETNCFLSAGGNNFLALFRSKNIGLNHYAFTIDNYDASRVVDTLDAAGLNPTRRQDRVYFDDRDGIEVQICGEWEDYPGPRPK